MGRTKEERGGEEGQESQGHFLSNFLSRFSSSIFQKKKKKICKIIKVVKLVQLKKKRKEKRKKRYFSDDHLQLLFFGIQASIPKNFCKTKQKKQKAKSKRTKSEKNSIQRPTATTTNKPMFTPFVKGSNFCQGRLHQRFLLKKRKKEKKKKKERKKEKKKKKKAINKEKQNKITYK